MITFNLRLNTNLPQCENSFLRSRYTSFQHDVVVPHIAVVGEASERGDGLLRGVELGGRVVLDDLAVLGVHPLPDAVDLLVDLRAVVVAFLAGTGHRVLHPTGMPRANTRNLSQTLVGLPRQFLCVPTTGDTC